MSGEMIAITVEQQVNGEDVKHPSGSNGNIEISEEQRAINEKKKLSLAPSFDKLVEVNIGLTQAVTRLVQVSYLMIVAQLILAASYIVTRK